jgi:hypothetical protein
MVQKASMFLDEGQSHKLRSLVEDYRDICRVKAKVKPSKAHLKFPNEKKLVSVLDSIGTG